MSKAVGGHNQRALESRTRGAQSATGRRRGCTCSTGSSLCMPRVAMKRTSERCSQTTSPSRVESVRNRIALHGHGGTITRGKYVKVAQYFDKESASMEPSNPGEGVKQPTGGHQPSRSWMPIRTLSHTWCRSYTVRCQRYFKSGKSGDEHSIFNTHNGLVFVLAIRMRHRAQGYVPVRSSSS